MTLADLAKALHLEPIDASDHLWQLGLVAEPDTDLSGTTLKAAREYLATFAARSRPTPQPLDSRPTTSQPEESTTEDVASASSPDEANPPPVRVNVEPPSGPHRIYELSQETGIPTAALITAAQRIGFEADHVTQLKESDIQAMWVALQDVPLQGSIEKRVTSGVKRRRRLKS